MINRIKNGALTALLTVPIILTIAAAPATAQSLGDSCPPERAGYGIWGNKNLLVCNGSTWQRVLRYDETGRAFFEKLEIDGDNNAGDLVIRGDGNGTTYSGLRLIDDTNDRFWSLRHTESGPGANFLSLGYDNGSLAEMLTIKPTGEIGIGTDNPGAKLEIAGQVKITGGTPGAGKILMSDADGLASWGAAPATDLASVLAAGNDAGGANIVMGNGSLTGLAAPVANSDATNKEYVDTAVAAGSGNGRYQMACGNHGAYHNALYCLRMDTQTGNVICRHVFQPTTSWSPCPNPW